MNRLPFDASREFDVWALKLLAAGRWYVRGDRFDKHSVPPKLLKDLYDQGQLLYPGEHGFQKVDPLLAKRERIKNAKGAQRKPSLDENAQVDALMDAHEKKDLLKLAKGLPDVKPYMNKRAIALALVRAEHARNS